MRKTRNSKRKIHLGLCSLITSFSFAFLISLEAKGFSSNEQSNKEPLTSTGESIENALSLSDEISDWEARLELARVLSYLKKYDESLQEYKTLLQAKPDSFIIRIEMAKVLFYQEKMEEALEELSLVPSQKLDDASLIMIADIYRKQKNYAKAENIYSQYLNKFPEDDKVRLKLAQLLSWDKRYEESINHYRIILTHRPEDIQVRRQFAQILTWMERDEEAIKEWKTTLE